MNFCENLAVSSSPASSFVSVLAERQPKRELHVLTLAPFYPTHGDEGSGCFIAEPLRALEEAGIRNSVVLATPFYRRSRAIASTVAAATRANYFALPTGLGLASSGTFLFFKIASSIRQLHARRRLDLIHAHGALPCGHAAALLSRELGIPYVVSVHGLDAYCARQVKGLCGRWCERASRLTYESARRVICVSESVQHEVNKAGSFATEVVYNGVDPILFHRAREASSTRPLVLSVGDLIPSKGHDVLLSAVAELLKDFPAIRCEIVGEGRERDRLFWMARDLGICDRVEFLGRLSRREVAEAMQRCTVFALPSSYEALGCVYMEAMACGKPVIGCRGQGIGELIRSGTNGFLMEPGDVQNLAAILSRLLRDPDTRRNTGAEAHRTVHDHFTIRHQAEALCRIYAECSR